MAVGVDYRHGQRIGQVRQLHALTLSFPEFHGPEFHGPEFHGLNFTARSKRAFFDNPCCCPPSATAPLNFMPSAARPAASLAADSRSTTGAVAPRMTKVTSPRTSEF